MELFEITDLGLTVGILDEPVSGRCIIADQEHRWVRRLRVPQWPGDVAQQAVGLPDEVLGHVRVLGVDKVD